MVQSDDEGLEDERLTDSTFPYVNADLPFEDMDKRLYQALQYQVSGGRPCGRRVVCR